MTAVGDGHSLGATLVKMMRRDQRRDHIVGDRIAVAAGNEVAVTDDDHDRLAVASLDGGPVSSNDNGLNTEVHIPRMTLPGKYELYAGLAGTIEVSVLASGGTETAVPRQAFGPKPPCDLFTLGEPFAGFVLLVASLGVSGRRGARV